MSDRMLQILTDRLGLRDMDSDTESPDARDIVMENLDPVEMFSQPTPSEPEPDEKPKSEPKTEAVTDPDFSKASLGAQLIEKHGSIQRIEEEGRRLKQEKFGAKHLGRAGFDDEMRQDLADIQAYLDGEDAPSVADVAGQMGKDASATAATVLGLVGKAAIAIPDLASKIYRWEPEFAQDTADEFGLGGRWRPGEGALTEIMDDQLVRLSEAAQGYNKELGNFMDWHKESLYERGGVAAVNAYNVGVATAETVIALKSAQFMTGAAYGSTAMKGTEVARNIGVAKKLGLITKDTAKFVKGINSTRDAIESTSALLQSGTAAKVGARLVHGLKMAGVMQVIKPQEGVDFDPERAAKDYFISAAYMSTPAISGLAGRFAPLVDVLINSGITAGLGKHRDAMERGVEEGARLGATEDEAFWLGAGNVFMEASTDVMFGMKTLGYGAETVQARERLPMLQEQLHVAVREKMVIDQSIRQMGSLVKGSMIDAVERDRAHRLQDENLTLSEQQVIRNEANIRIADIESRSSDQVLNSVVAKAIHSKRFPKMIQEFRESLDRRMGVKAGTLERLNKVDLPAAKAEANEVRQAESMKLHNALPYMMKNMDAMPTIPQYGGAAFKAYDQFRQKLADDFAEVIRPEQAEQLRDSYNNPQLDVWKIVESHIGKDKFMSQNQFQREYSEMSKTWRDQFFGTKKALAEGKVAEILETTEFQKHNAEELARNAEALSTLESVAMSGYKSGKEISRREAKLNQAKLADGELSKDFGKNEKHVQEAYGWLKREAERVAEELRDGERDATPEEIYNAVAERIAAGERSGLGDRALDYVREKIVPIRVVEPERVEESLRAADATPIIKDTPEDAAKATEPTRTTEPEAARPEAAAAAEPTAKPPIQHNLKPFIDTSDKYTEDFMTKQTLERYGFSLDNLRESHGKLTEDATADLRFLSEEIDRLVSDIGKETFGDRVLTDAENETLSRFQHAVQLKATPTELPSDVKGIYDKMRSQYDLVYDMVNERRIELGMTPLPKIPDYAPFLRKGQLSDAELGDPDARGSMGDLDRIYNMFQDPASMHHRSPLKEWELYEGNATKSFEDYNRSMLGWLMLNRSPSSSAKRLRGGELTPFEKKMLNFDAVSDRLAAEFDQLRQMVGSLPVTHARAAWEKARVAGKDDKALNDLERYGQEIETRIEGVRDTVKLLGMSREAFDVMSPTRAVEIVRLDNWGTMHGFGNVSKIEINTENPFHLVSRIDNQWMKSPEKSGPVTDKFQDVQQDVLRKAQITRAKETELVKMLEQVYQQEISGRDNKAINLRLTEVWEYHKSVENKRRLARMTNEQMAQVIRTEQDSKVTGKDIQAYRKIMGNIMDFRSQYDHEIRRLAQVKDQAFRAPGIFSPGKKLFFGMVEGSIAKIALAASQADNIDHYLRASEYFRDTAKGITDPRLRISEWMARYAKEALAHGLHPIDERVANVGQNKSLQRMEEEKTAARTKVGQWMARLNKDKGSIALELLQGGSAMLSTRYLLGNPKWNFARQGLSLGNIPATTSIVASLGSLQKNAVLGLSALSQKVGLENTTVGRILAESDAKMFHMANSTAIQIKNMTRAGVSGAELDMATHELNRSFMHRLRGYSGWLGHTMENGTGSGAYQAGIYEGLRRGMSGKRLQYFADMTVATTQSMYNRESRALLLNSVVWRAIFPFQTFAFDASRALTSEFLREDDDKRERFAQVMRLMVGLGMTEVISQSVFRRPAFKGLTSFVPGLDRFVEMANVGYRTWRDAETALGGVANVAVTMPANIVPSIEMVRSGPWKAIWDFRERGDKQSVEMMQREFGAIALAGAGVGGSQIWDEGFKGWQAMQNHGYMPWRPPRDRQLQVIDEGMGWATLKDWMDFMFRVPMQETDTARRHKQLKQ